MKKLLLCVLLLRSISAFAMGWGDWQRETPGGSTMTYPGGSTELRLFNGKEISGIKSWYFYHEHIVGECYDGFFIAAERGGIITRFPSRATWEAAITRQRLAPSLWTRCYHENRAFYERVALLC